MMPKEKKKLKRVGVMRGGEGRYYASSLQKGGEIISLLFENLADKYKVADILVDKEGTWHLNGLPIKPSELAHKVDVVWNTAHPNLSIILDNFSIPNVGNGSFSLALENSGSMLREHMEKVGIQMPRSIILPVYQKDFDGLRERYAIKKAKEVFEKFPAPWVVKSFSPDSNMAVHLAKTFGELSEAIEDGVKHNQSILVEEFITGKIASIHSVPKFRNQKIYTFPLGNTYGYFSPEEKEKLFFLTKTLHEHLGAKHYLKSDFVLTSRGKVYLLGINFTPNLKQDSHLFQVAESVGATMHHLIDHILETTLN